MPNPVDNYSTASDPWDDLKAAMDEPTDAARYADPLSFPALAWSLQHGDNAARWLWHAGALYRYAEGAYRRDGAEWAAQKLHGIIELAADRAADAARERAEESGPDWRATADALNLLVRTLPGGATAKLREAARAGGLWPSPEAARQSVEWRYTKIGLLDPVLLSMTAGVRRSGEGESVDADPHTLNVANGLLDLRSMALRPHDPDHPSTIQVPVAYDPDADCQRFGDFLREVLPADCIPVAEEMMGLLLVPDTSHHKAFLFLGGGSNGKSVLIDVLGALLGKDNISATPLQSLGEDKWAAASLVGKLANLCADLPAATQKDTSTFKLLVAGDEVKAEEKYRPPFTFRPFARLVFSANEAPGTVDVSHGYWRRWITIPFPRRFAEPTNAAAMAEGARPIEPGLRDRLLSELPGILNLALVGLARLRAQGGFTASPSCDHALAQYQERADSVAAFLAEACELDARCMSGHGALYAAYRDWCLAAGREPLGRNRFGERVDATPGVREERDQARTRCWGGIRLRLHGVAPAGLRRDGGRGL